MSLLADYNYVKKLSVIPCGQPDWWVIVETAFKAAGPALLTLGQPGCNEILKARLGLSPWHARSIKALIKGAIKPFPVSEVKFLYKIGYFTLEKYLWWFLVAEVTKEFAITWQSMIYQQQQCQLPGAGTASGIFLPWIFGPHAETRLSWSITHPKFGVFGTSEGIAIRPGFEGTVAYSIQWQGYPDPAEPANVTTSIEEIGGPGPEDEMDTYDPTLKNGDWTQGHLYHQKIGAVVATQYRINVVNNGDNLVQVKNGTFSIGLHGRRSGNLTWGCNLKPVSWPFPNPLE